MGNDKERQTSNTAVDTSVVWLVSFGDLLTLLFCFFLILTPRLGGSLVNESTKEHVSDRVGAEILPGTSLATLDQEGRGMSLGFIPVTVARERALSSDERRAQVTAALDNLRTRTGKLERIKVCVGSSSAARMQELYTATRLAYGELGGVEFEYEASCSRAAREVSADVDLIAVIEFSIG